MQNRPGSAIPGLDLQLLANLRPLVDGLDVSSGGEIRQAPLADYRGSDLSFAGPGKTSREIELALRHDCGSLSIDGLTQNIANVLQVVDKICRENDLAPVRINFGGGLGVPYFSSDTDFDLAEFAGFVNGAVA